MEPYEALSIIRGVTGEYVEPRAKAEVLFIVRRDEAGPHSAEPLPGTLIALSSETAVFVDLSYLNCLKFDGHKPLLILGQILLFQCFEDEMDAVQE
jgi:hypothetical protein